MRIKNITIRNWMRYVGEQTLSLEAKAYAVVAHSPENPERSNWLGKTSFLEAIDFVLWGQHQFRTEDEWITRGQSSGSVAIEFDTGEIVVRSRDKGKRTSLEFKGAKQDEAQLLIADMIGISESDFHATCFFKQKQMSKLVMADVSARMEIVSGWLRLAPLERCEEKVRAEASAITNQIVQLEATLTGVEDLERSTLDGQTREKIKEYLASSASALEKRRLQIAEAQRALLDNAKSAGAATTVQNFELLVADGKLLKSEVDKYDEEALKKRSADTNAELLESYARVRRARDEKDAKRDLASGEFDGKCPVAGITCPAQETINKDRKRNLVLYNEAKSAYEVAEKQAEHKRQAETEARAKHQEFERKESRLADMRKQAAKMEEAYEEALGLVGKGEDPSILKMKFDDATRRYDELTSQAKEHESKIKTLDSLELRKKSLTAQIETARTKLSTYREASVIFGKQGAQRRVAEGGLAEIEAGANAMLKETSSDLSLSVQWAREGSGLAKACDACGNPFPASAKVKVCPRCQAPRGPNLINKLDFALSDRSGAAEDMAGIALQLSASAWLRNERGSLWETAMLDEPFGALDAHNRKSLGRHLAALLRGRYGFTQAFVVAHSPDVLAALPGRIEIVGGANGSIIRVLE